MLQQYQQLCDKHLELHKQLVDRFSRMGRSVQDVQREMDTMNSQMDALWDRLASRGMENQVRNIHSEMCDSMNSYSKYAEANKLF